MSDSDFIEDVDDCRGKNNSNHFYGVYLMISVNPEERSKTYIGFTNDPENRIKRHNNKGGAKSTHGKGPWKMILIIHGFPNELYALKFEWAWQSPEKSRRLKHIEPKQKSENGLTFRLRILSHMLRIGPWWRLGLTIQWLCPEYEQPFPINLQPPQHMPIAYGSIELNKNSKSKIADIRLNENLSKYCAICEKLLGDKWVVCLNESCSTTWDLVCIAEHFLKGTTFLLPIEGKCPNCNVNLVWSRLVEHLTFQSARVRNK